MRSELEQKSETFPVSEELRRIELRPIEPFQLRGILKRMEAELTQVGIGVEVSEKGKKSLNRSKLRSLLTGRGPGVVEVLETAPKGEERAKRWYDWCKERSEGGPRIGTNEETDGRGLKQFTADLLVLITNPAPTDADLEIFCWKTNNRILKGLKWEGWKNILDEEVLKQSRRAFENSSKPPKTLAAIPPGSIGDLWDLLVTRRK
jgi:hypothetical protein